MDSTTSVDFCRLLKCAIHWSFVCDSARLFSVWLEKGRLVVGSTNKYGASLVSWPADADASKACSVELDRLRRVRSMRGLLALVKRADAPPSFDRAYLERIIGLPDLAAFVTVWSDLSRIAVYLKGSLSDKVMLGAANGSLLVDGAAFPANILQWKGRDTFWFRAGLLSELFGHVLSESLRVSIKRDGAVTVLHVTGEFGEVTEHHFLAGLSWKND